MSAPVLSWLFSRQGKPEASSGSRARRHGPQPVRPQSQRSSHQTRTPRPNPQSQSFSRSYGSILPTSLIYIVLSTRGCSPWRPDAVMSTTRGANKSLPRIFKGRRSAPDTSRRKVLCQPLTLSPAIRFQGDRLLKRKENSSQGSRRVSEFACVAASVSTSWFGNINPIPFR